MGHLVGLRIGGMAGSFVRGMGDTDWARQDFEILQMKRIVC